MKAFKETRTKRRQEAIDLAIEFGDAYIEWYDLDEEDAAEDVLAMVADRFHGHEEEDTDERLDAAVDDALTDAAETPDPTSGFAGVLRSVLDG